MRVISFVTCLYIFMCICPATTAHEVAHLPRGHPGDPFGFFQLMSCPELVQRMEGSQFCLGQSASGQTQY